MAKVLWRGTATSIVLSWLLLSIFVITFGVIVLGNRYASPDEKLTGLAWIGPISVIVIGLLTSLFSSRVAVEVDEDELRVRFGFGWPVRHIHWSHVETVECVDVRPWQWGGWGYRVNLGKRSSAVVLRAGEGLRLTLTNRRTFVVTVDGAKRGLEVIRGILSDPRHA